MQRLWGAGSGSGRCGCCAAFGLAAAWLALALGCGSGEPFPTVHVRGKVTFRDGSLIKADRIVITFIPQGASASGKAVPGGAHGEVKVVDGTFGDLTTHKPMDGVVPGRHRVVIQPLIKGPGGTDMPAKVIPVRYTQPDKTPLEVEVKKSGEVPALLIDRE